MIIIETPKNAGKSERRRIGVSHFQNRTDVLVTLFGGNPVLLTRAQARRLGKYLLEGKNHVRDR